ncbi:MAG: hypothetical protein R3E02_13250 [Blastomonas sp.]
MKRMIFSGLAAFAMMGVSVPAQAQLMSDMAPYTEISLDSVNRALAPGNIVAQNSTINNGTAVIQFVYDGVVMNIEPRECDRAGRGCQAGVIRAFFDVPPGTDVSKLVGAVDQFNRANAFLKASVVGQNRVLVTRYHAVHFGVHYGTVRREYANFAQSFNLLLQQYVSPVVPIGQ